MKCPQTSHVEGDRFLHWSPKDSADPPWFVVVVLPPQVFFPQMLLVFLSVTLSGFFKMC